MRTLSATLRAAQQGESTEPYVDVVAENSLAGIRRLDFVQLDATANTIASHDAAIAGDGSLTRVRSDGAGNVLQQRVANPGAGPWNAWNNIGAGKGNLVACAARGARVIVVYVDAAGTGIKMRESTDNGQTYAAEVAVTTAAAAVVDLAVTYKNTTGDHAIAWVTAATLNAIVRTGGAYGAASASGVSVSSLNGVAMTYVYDWNILVTGVEVTTLRRCLWAITFGDGFDKAVGVWDVLLPQLQAESDSSVAYSAPSLAYTDTFRMTYVEADTFTGGNTRTYRTSLHPLNGWIAGANYVRQPVPVNYAGAQGLALAADANQAGYVYECAPDLVQRAAQSLATLSLTNDVLAVDIDERAGSTRGFVELDNTAGTYAGPPALLALGNRLKVKWGYRTSAGVETSQMADVWIAAHEWRRQGGVSTLRLHVEGAWELMRRSRQRTQIVHTGGDPYCSILTRMFSRAGLALSVGSASTRAKTTNPKFTIHPQTSAYEAAQQALAFVADRVRLRTNATADLIEFLASAASSYTYGAAHPVGEIRLRAEAPPISEAHAFGAGAFGEAIDYATAQAMTATREQQRDLTSASGAAAAATATATLRRRALDADAGRIVSPPNVGQEVYDLVDFTDLLVSGAAVKRRVKAVRRRYDRHAGVYEQTLDLGAA